MKNNKILTLPKLARKIEKLKKNNKTVVHCHGVFDVLHIGYKWVRLRLSAKPHKNAHKISIVTWNKIIKRKDFVILEDNR